MVNITIGNTKALLSPLDIIGMPADRKQPQVLGG